MSEKAKRPTLEQFDTAILWLLENEGEGDEGENCRAVADWLTDYRNNIFLRAKARAAGVSVGALKNKLAAITSNVEG